MTEHRPKYMYMRMSDLTEDQLMLSMTMYPECPRIRMDDGELMVVIGILADLKMVRIKSPIFTLWAN